MQGLRREVKDITSHPPQPEDPERSLDPDSEEDPDISVELIDGVFHQLSRDNALVAIIADYPGLIPASQVIEAGAFTLLEGISLFMDSSCSDSNRVLQGRFPRREADPAAAGQRGATGPRGAKRNIIRTEVPEQRYNVPSFSLVFYSFRVY